ncbi:MAG: nitrate- and nitrite sensing domain-containing protein [Pseudonocardiaceae bacterium]
MTGPGATLARWHWRNWPVLVKLVVVVLVPTLVALIVGVLRIVDQAGAAPRYLRISQIAGVQQQLAELIGAVQRERKLAAAFVATGRSGDRAPLDAQFGAVQARAAAVRTTADQVDDLEPTGYRIVLDELRALRPLRQSTLTGFGPVKEVVTEYGAAIDPLIALDAALVRQLDDVAVTDDAAAAHALMVSREQVSRQHAIVSAALPANRISSTQIDQVRAAAVRLGAEQEAFTAALEPAQRGSYVPRAMGEGELSRQRLLQLVLDRGVANRPLDISPADWDARNAAVIEELATVETELRQRIDRTALTLRDDARAAAGWSAAILIFALLLGVVIAVVIARSMLGPLGVLRRTALDVAGRRLPAAMARIREGTEPEQAIEPVAVSTQEEIGQVARAFDEVHRQAARLAGEQARLRAHVNDIFVNLSRRSQGLVERQLKLIDRLESAEQDPEALDNLFQLDHLATRMRRNNDNLLVLAGTAVATRSSRPVRLVDVLRAAVSEVEQYQRVILQQPPGILVLGRPAGDLVHLLAELLDNATQFSPPDTHVLVSAEVGEDGEVMIEVVDRGVGMTELEFADANEWLASSPVVDASVSRRMGLFVVGRLAVRHGLTVRLRGGADGLGVCASVRVPSWLVKSVSEGVPRGVCSGPHALPAGNVPVPDVAEGSAPEVAEPVAGSTIEAGTTLVSQGYFDGQGGPLTNGHGAGGRPAVTLQHATPIFDDVATAWFQEHQAVPVRWTAADSPDQPADSPQDAQDAPRDDWGAGDEGWWAAQALASPTVSAGITAAGLPRRMPRALLVPGAAGGSAAAEFSSVPVRSAELIRGRLASYQQGLRDGRQARRNRDQHASGSHQQQDAEEETQ